MDTIQISAKNLGALAMPDCCGQCLWLKLRLSWKLPWQIFPGIFSSIDSYTKKVVSAHFAERGCVPQWVPEGTPMDCPHWSKFSCFDSATSIRLVGAPDEMIRLPSGRLGIYDYKCARHTDHQDELLPIYAVQLNAYAWIAEQLGMGKTEELALIYCEPQTDLPSTRLNHFVRKTGFSMGFAASKEQVPIDAQVVPRLLQRVRQIVAGNMPASSPACKDCQRMAELLSLITPSLTAQ